MARKELRYQVSDEGRDKGKVFLIQEMPAAKAERWAIRAFLALGKNGIAFPEDALDAGFASLARFGIQLICQLPFEEAESLLNEMFDCVSIIPNPKSPDVIRSLIEDDIEEIKTRLKIRGEIFKLHTDFFLTESN